MLIKGRKACDIYPGKPGELGEAITYLRDYLQELTGVPADWERNRVFIFKKRDQGNYKPVNPHSVPTKTVNQSIKQVIC